MKVINKFKSSAVVLITKLSSVCIDILQKFIYKIVVVSRIKLKRQIVIHAYPDFEDQTKAILQKAFKTGIKVVVLTTSKKKVDWDVDENLYIAVRKSSFRGAYYFYTSKWVFYTHGIFWVRYPRDGQQIINLWHGIPFKKVGSEIGIQLPFAHYLVASSEGTAYLFERMYESHRTPEILPFGLPRNDLIRGFRDDIDQSQNKIRKLIWLPTYRKSMFGELRQDGIFSETNLGLSAVDLVALDKKLSSLDISVELKAHPATRVSLPVGLKAIRLLDEVPSSFYNRLSEYDGLISDYSSVIADFAILGKPIFLYGQDRSEYSESRGLFVNPGELLGVKFMSSSEELLGALVNPRDFVPTKKAVAFLHRNLNSNSTDLIWERINISPNGESNLHESRMKSDGLIRKFVNFVPNFYGVLIEGKKETRFFDQLISAVCNYLTLFVAFLFLPANESAQVFIYFASYTLLLGIVRFFFGDYLLLNGNLPQWWKFYFITSIPIFGIVIVGMSIFGQIRIVTDLTTFIILVLGSGMGILQDLLRYYGLRSDATKKVLVSDLIWLVSLSAGLLYLLAFSSDLGALQVIYIFCLSAFMSICALYIMMRNDLQQINSKIKHKFRIFYRLQLALITITGTLTNFFINTLITLFGSAVLLSNLRGIQLFLIPIAFLGNSQQINWMPSLARGETRGVDDLFSNSILSKIKAPILVIALGIGFYFAGWPGLVAGVFLYAEALINFRVGQFGYLARANEFVKKYLYSRLLWSGVTILLVWLSLITTNITLLSLAILTASLLGFVFARKSLGPQGS
jgi:CDP-glycerol glycerophosphotransferase (TagB/SpsB family)